MNSSIGAVICAAWMWAALPCGLAAQQPMLLTGGDTEAVGTSTAPVVVNRPEPKALTARWLDLTNFSHSQRYRNQYGDDGYHYWENGQERSLLSGKVKIDKDGKYAVGFRVSSGRSFNWAYADYAGRALRRASTIRNITPT